MYTLVFAFKPAGKRPPYIIDACDSPRTEEVFLHKPYRVLYGALAFRIRFVTDPELQFLFGTEVFEHASFNDFAIGFAGNEHGILINNQHGRTPTDPAEAPVNGLTGLYSIVFMVLRINT